MSQEMCRCCGREPAVTAEMAAWARTAPPRSFVITDEMRQKFPPDALGRLEEMQRRSRPRVPPAVRVGFCSMCSSAGCDGVAPCKIPSEHWHYQEKQAAEMELMSRIADLERRRALGEFGKPSLEVDGGWERVTADYWRKEMSGPGGTLHAQVAGDPARNLWLGMLKPDHEPEPLRVGPVTLQYSTGTTLLPDLGSLQEAQAACEEMAAELLSEGAQPGMSLTIGYGMPLEGSRPGEPAAGEGE